MNGNLVRLGGLFGLLSVVAMIPAYLVGYPDAPGSPVEARAYFEAGLDLFVVSNGVLPLFHVFFFLLFLGVLYGVLGSAGDSDRRVGEGLPAAALAGGIVFATLSAASGVHGGDPLPGGPTPLRGSRIRCRFRTRVVDTLRLAVPLLSDRSGSHGAHHLPGSPRNGCPAEVAGPRGPRGRAPNAVALPRAASGCLGGAGVDSGSLGTDARWECWV